MAMQMHDNMLAVYPELLNKVRSIIGVAVVKEASDLAIFMSEAKTQRKVAPAYGAVYVVYGGHALDGSAGQGKLQKNTLFFTLVYCARYLEGGKSTLYETGATLTAIKKALQGWDPGKEFVLSPFVESNSPPIEYNDGYAFYPISFTTTVCVAAN